MNDKKAKALRRTARNLTEGMPLVAYQPMQSRRVFATPIPVPGTPSALFLGDLRMAPDCTRAVYQKLKKAARIAS